MISLFAFIHLKTEISFLFMFKNRIREMLFIFWMLPVISMLVVKGGILTGYLAYLVSQDSVLSTYIILSLSLTFIVASIAFYPINRWCFNQFTGDRLNLYALHKGR
jgi:Na+/melibiose symporter-like transporter